MQVTIDDMNLPKRLEELGYVYCKKHVMMGSSTFEDVWVKYDKTGVVASLEALIPNDTLTAIEQDILSMIGDDEDYGDVRIEKYKVPKNVEWFDVPRVDFMTRNQLRAELRTKLHKYIKGKED